MEQNPEKTEANENSSETSEETPIEVLEAPANED